MEEPRDVLVPEKVIDDGLEVRARRVEISRRGDVP